MDLRKNTHKNSEMISDNPNPELVKVCDAFLVKQRSSRKHTFIIGFRILAPWTDKMLEDTGFKFYSVYDDAEVEDTSSIAVKYMNGCNIPPHITIAIGDKFDNYLQIFKNLQETVKPFLKEVTLKCIGVSYFPTSPAAKKLRAKGEAVILRMKASKNLEIVRNTVQGSMGFPLPFFQGVEKGVSHKGEWYTHITVAYVPSDDKKNREKLIDWLTNKFLGHTFYTDGWMEAFDPMEKHACLACEKELTN